MINFRGTGSRVVSHSAGPRNRMERKKLFSTLWHHSYPSSGFQVPRTAFYIYTFYHVLRINFLAHLRLHCCVATLLFMSSCTRLEIRSYFEVFRECELCHRLSHSNYGTMSYTRLEWAETYSAVQEKRRVMERELRGNLSSLNEMPLYSLSNNLKLL